VIDRERPAIAGSVSVVIPAYNEAHHIVANLQETAEALAELGAPFEVILVDDGSSDATWAEAVNGNIIEVRSSGSGRANRLTHAQAVQLENGRPVIRILQYHNRRGKGHALACGSDAAHGDYVVFLDADFDLHPSQLRGLFEILAQENADVVIGSKLHPDSRVDYPWIRRVMSIGYYYLVRMLFGLPVRDTQTGLKVFKSEVLRSVLPKVSAEGFAFDVAVLAAAHSFGYKICEAPITIEARRRYSRIKITDIAFVAKETLAIFYRQRILRTYARPNVERRRYQSQVEMIVRPSDEFVAR